MNLETGGRGLQKLSPQEQLLLCYARIDSGAVDGRLGSDPGLPLLAKQVSRRLFQAESMSARANWQHYRFQLKLLAGLSDRLRYLRYLITPHNTAPGYLTLPRWLYPVYYVTRPLRFLINICRSQA